MIDHVFIVCEFAGELWQAHFFDKRGISFIIIEKPPAGIQFDPHHPVGMIGICLVQASESIFFVIQRSIH